MGLLGFGPIEAALFNVTQKLARLKALRANGRMHDISNESVIDTYLDLAVYSIITTRWCCERSRSAERCEGSGVVVGAGRDLQRVRRLSRTGCLTWR
jgi:hypothetical protein